MLITGPVKGGRRGWPFSAAVFDVGQYGYVEEEFFIDGEATAYEPAPGTALGPEGRWQLQPRSTAPYRTRFLVVRPRHPAGFSGNVMLSWANVSAGFELGGVSVRTLRHGDAHVTMSVQKVGLDGYPGAEANALRGWDPERYGSLTHPGDDFSYDMLTQIARSVGPDRKGGEVDPMPGLEVRQVVAMGGSQSAIRLLSYLNGVHRMTHVLDGALLLVGFGQAASFEAEAHLPGQAGVFPPGVRVRDDLDIPVFILSTETEAEQLYGVRQPDGPLLRTWEIAGAAHGGAAASLEETQKKFLRDGLEVPPGLGGPRDAPGSLPNSVSYFPILDAAQWYLMRWAAAGEPPPSFPFIEIAGDPPAVVRDEHGNALGGIRMPDLEAPIATYRGRGESADLLASLSGTTLPFSDQKIRALYPKRADYLQAYTAAVDRGVEAGWFLPDGAEELRASAEKRAADLRAW